MEKKKYIVELDISEETKRVITVGMQNLDEIVKTRIGNALFPIDKRFPKVYPYGGAPAPEELFTECPFCHHPWGKHFDYVDKDGKKLPAPIPTQCSECSPQNPCNPASIIQEEMETRP